MLRALSTVLLLLLIGPWSSPRAESLPRKNLWVELRWVETQVSAAAVAGVRDGAVVLGTAGSVSPRGQVVLSTDKRQSGIQAMPRLLVLNGSQASVQLSETTPVQWLDYGVETAATTRSAQIGGPQVYAVPRTALSTQTRSVSLSPRWPGDRQPVTVELRSQLDQPSAELRGTTQQTLLLSTVQLPLGEWLTIARSGDTPQAAPRGSLSTRDAEPKLQRELQLRVELAP
jgi:hypothetical protein